MSTSLYRHFGNDGSLLYVGISLSWPSRTKAHAHGSRWFDQVARVEIEQFATREAALEAEREAIKREKPKFNVIHNRSAPVKPSKRKPRPASNDPLTRLVTGPDAIVGPPLVYRDDKISIIIAHGESGSPGVLDEVILGRFYSNDLPSWAHMCATVITIRRGDDLTLDEAREARRAMVQNLKRHLRTVEVVETDLALALANASRFPSAKARQVLDDLVAEKGMAA